MFDICIDKQKEKMTQDYNFNHCRFVFVFLQYGDNPRIITLIKMTCFFPPLYVCVHVCLCICAGCVLCTCVCVCVCVHLPWRSVMCMCVYQSVCVYLRVCVCGCSMHPCRSYILCVRGRACMHVCMCMRTCMHACVCVRVRCGHAHIASLY